MLTRLEIRYGSNFTTSSPVTSTNHKTILLQFDWIRSAGATSSVGTGPPNDHTTGTDTGLYMYAEVSGQKPGNQAWIYSPLISAAPGGACCSFWYHMYGQGQYNYPIRSKGTNYL